MSETFHEVHSAYPSSRSAYAETIGRHALTDVVGNILYSTKPSPKEAEYEDSAENIFLQQVFAPIPKDASDERLTAYKNTHENPTREVTAWRTADGEYNFDFGFDGNSRANHEVNRLLKNLKEFTTEETISSAANRITDLVAKDDSFKEILDKHCGKHMKPDGIAEMIRFDGVLRLNVGEHMLSRIDTYIKKFPEHIPERVLDNGFKNPGKSPLKILLPDKMSSRAYAALLAVSMLDGTWNDSEISVDDRMQFNARGVATSGQHEAMAKLILSEGGYRIGNDSGGIFEN